MASIETTETLYMPTGGWPRFAIESLLRLQEALEREQSAEQLLHGAELEQARAMLSRAIFSLYLDCEQAGVGDDARRLLGQSPNSLGSVCERMSGTPERLLIA